jgi:hypothetical protein
MGAVIALAMAVGALMVSSSIAGSLETAVTSGPALFKLHAPVELNSANPQANGIFGESTAIGGGCVAVGAPYEKLPGAYVWDGNVYLFNSTNGQLTQTISSPNPRAYGQFGWAVAMSGTTLVVGAPNETARGNVGAGNAYTYTFTASCVATLEATMAEPHPQAGKNSVLPGGEFGWSVAISGADVIVGAPNETAHGLAAAGNAYLFAATTGASIASLTTPNPTVGGEYGYSVSLAGATAYVGAPFEGSGGHVYIVFKSTGAASGTTTYTLASPRVQGGGFVTGGAFGFAVSVGSYYLVVGAGDENASGETFSGAAYVYNSSTGILDYALENPDPQAGGVFGYSVVVSGSDVVVGAPAEADANNDSAAGNATVYDALNGTALVTLQSPNAATMGYFGYVVAAGDGEIVIGAPTETAEAISYAGHAYVY